MPEPTQPPLAPVDRASLVAPSGQEPVTLVAVPDHRVVPDRPIGGTVDVAVRPGLPVLLAGPILRRAARDAVNIWVATSHPVTVVGTIHDPQAPTVPLGSGTASPITLGDNLFLTIVKIVPTRTASADPLFPIDKLLAYDLTFIAPPHYAFERPGGLVKREGVAYGDAPGPRFLLGTSHAAFKFVHASCRKLHGSGHDLIVKLDQHLGRVASHLADRPSALLLTGDQIYADDVHGGIITGIIPAARELFGWSEFLPATEPTSTATESLVSALDGGRRGEIVTSHGFTAERTSADWHLMGFAEFAAMYLFAWSPVLWEYAPIASHIRHDGAREATAARRVMANVPCYMIMDDHEVTDDWPILRTRSQNVKVDPISGWVVANGWASAWMFQHAGNYIDGFAQRPDVHTPTINYLVTGMATHGNPAARAAHRVARSGYVSALTASQDFGFVTATTPPVLFLDTRTQRELRDDGSPGLMSTTAFASMRGRVEGMRTRRHDWPLIVVSPAVVIGFDIVEMAQRLSSNSWGFGGVGTPTWFEKDPETWTGDGAAFFGLFHELALAGADRVLFLSGDIHYAMAARGSCSFPADGLPTFQFAQFVSSALRNAPTATQQHAQLRAAGAVSGDQRFQVLNTTPPTLAESSEQPSAAILMDMTFGYLMCSHGTPDNVVRENNFGVVEILKASGTYSGSVIQTLVTHGGEQPPTVVRW